jgi:hypothetical protein
MQPKLVELASMLKQQLPVLLSFVVLRLFGVFAMSKTLSIVTPKCVRPYVRNAYKWVARMRSVAMAVGCGYLALQTFRSPPENVCTEYEAVKVQGTCAMLALGVLMASNGVLSSAVALSALMAVANNSASSLVFSTSAVVIANGDTALFSYCLFWVAIAHAGLCHSDTSPGSTHGSIVAVLAIIFNVMFHITKLLYSRCVHVTTSFAHSSLRVARLCKRVVD